MVSTFAALVALSATGQIQLPYCPQCHQQPPVQLQAIYPQLRNSAVVPQGGYGLDVRFRAAPRAPYVTEEVYPRRAFFPPENGTRFDPRTLPPWFLERHRGQ